MRVVALLVVLSGLSCTWMRGTLGGPSEAPAASQGVCRLPPDPVRMDLQMAGPDGGCPDEFSGCLTWDGMLRLREEENTDFGPPDPMP